MYIEVPDSIFLNRWWEVAVRAVFFLLGVSYSSVFGSALINTAYLAPPLLLIACAIMFGRTVAMHKKKAYEKKKAISEIMELELRQQHEAYIKNGLQEKERLVKELAEAKKALRQLMAARAVETPAAAASPVPSAAMSVDVPVPENRPEAKGSIPTRRKYIQHTEFK